MLFWFRISKVNSEITFLNKQLSIQNRFRFLKENFGKFTVTVASKASKTKATLFVRNLKPKISKSKYKSTKITGSSFIYTDIQSMSYTSVFWRRYENSAHRTQYQWPDRDWGTKYRWCVFTPKI